MSTVFNDQDYEIDKKSLQNIDSITVKRQRIPIKSLLNHQIKDMWMKSSTQILVSDSIKHCKTLSIVLLETMFAILSNMV